MALAHCIQHGHTPVDLHEADPKWFPSVVNSVEALTSRVPEVLGKHYEITYPGRQWASARNLKKLPLDARWREAGAHMGQIFGWERPLYFGKTGEPRLSFGRPDWFDRVACEVGFAHEEAAIFDQSSFGKIEIGGPDASVFLNRLCANQMDRRPGRAIYTSMLNERGGIESDLTAVRLRSDLYRLYVGTGSLKRDLNWLHCHRLDDERVTITDRTEDHAMLGLMGPKAATIATSAGADELNALRYFQTGKAEIAGYPVLATRLSYVGEAGWEITCSAEHASAIFNALHQAGAHPAGLLAQTSMRIEKSFLAYGHELDTDISPLMARLDFAVAWDTDFIGKASLLAQREAGVSNRVLTLKLHDRNATPLGSEPVLFGDKIIGKTTSAAFGYRVGSPVALAVNHGASVGRAMNEVAIDIGGVHYRADVIHGAAFDPLGSRMKSA
ncbi:MAG: glycine cleavage T C-terminal barrel domain-containing protein [Geminicoccaceae bacterium]